MICHVDGVYAIPISSCNRFSQLQEILSSVQQAEDIPGYPQEDIIILSNKGSVTVSQKRREERGSGLRTQGRTICLEGMQGKIWRYLQEERYK